MTKKEMFTMLLTLTEVQKDDVLVEMINHEIDLLNRVKTETPKQKENKEISRMILEHFKANNTALSCSEITEVVKGVNTWKAPVNIQRITNIVKGLKEEGVLERFMERKVPLYRLTNQ